MRCARKEIIALGVGHLVFFEQERHVACLGGRVAAKVDYALRCLV